jgi:hypothetical protein
VKELDLPRLYTLHLGRVEEVIAGNDYTAALKLYDNKGLVHKVAPCLEMNGRQYVEYSKRLLASKKGKDMRTAMAKYLPCLPRQQARGLEDA